jgi:ABC-2 type transport system permease protein
MRDEPGEHRPSRPILSREPIVTTLSVRPAASATGCVRRSAHAEWLKLRTVRSTPAILTFACLLTAGFAALIANGNTTRTGPRFDPVAMCMSGLIFGQYLFAVFGALTMTGEYGTGTIRATLAAAPRRVSLLTGKAIAVAAVAAAAALVVTACSLALCETFFFHHAPHAALTSAPVIRALWESALILVIASLAGLGVGALVRNTAAAMIVLAILFFLALPLVSQLPAGPVRTWAGWLLPWISTASVPRTAPMTHYAVIHHTPGPYSGLAAFAAEAGILLAAAALTLTRRDA